MRRLVVFEFECEPHEVVAFDMHVTLDGERLIFDVTNKGPRPVTVSAAPIVLNGHEVAPESKLMSSRSGSERGVWRWIVGILAALLLAGCVNGERTVEVQADAEVWMSVVDGVTPDGVKTCSGVVLALESNVAVGVFEGEKAMGSGRPARVTLQADAPHELIIRRAGCEPGRVTVRPVTSGSRVALFVVQCVLFPPALVRLPFALGGGEFADFEPGSVRVRLHPVGYR